VIGKEDPQAKVGRTKDGACDMIYKPEHVTDLESGAIVQAEVLEGDHADTKALSERVAYSCKFPSDVGVHIICCGRTLPPQRASFCCCPFVHQRLENPVPIN
jgi:hypothetical protein